MLLASYASGKLFEISDISGYVLDFDSLPTGLITCGRLPQTEPNRWRFDRLEYYRSIASADLVYPTLARSGLHKGGFDNCEHPFVLEDCESVVRKSIVKFRVVPQEGRDLPRNSKKQNRHIDKMTGKLEHHPSGMECERVSYVGREVSRDTAVGIMNMPEPALRNRLS